MLSFLITDLHRGGSPLLLADLAPALAARGIPTEVVSIAPPGEISSLLRKRGIKAVSLQAAGPRDWRVLPRYLEYLKLRRPRAVCSVLVHANLLAALARPRAGLPFAWVQSIHTVQPRPRWHWIVQGVVGAHADATVAPSHAVIRKLQRHGPVPRPLVIPNGIDVARFAHALPIDTPPWPAGTPVVGYVGRFDPVKRLPLLLRALEHLPAEVHLALAGYGSEQASLASLAEQLSLAGRVHFLGPVADPERWYKSFRVFCSPSAVEGYGLTLAEAACAGVPVVACDTPAVRETLPEATLVPSRTSPTQLARALQHALASPALALPDDVLAERYSRDHMADAYASLFRTLLQGA